MKAQVILTCGRLWLVVNGVFVAMQGDKCRDPDVIAAAMERPPLPPEFGGDGHPGAERGIWDKDTLEASLVMIESGDSRPAAGAER